MSAMLTIRDQTAAGLVFHSFALLFPGTRTTVRKLIETRVRHEVAEFNASQGSEMTFHGLVQPVGSEQVRGGFRLKKSRVLDVEQQCRHALDAFDHNGFIVLVGEHQAESLDEEITIGPDIEVSFVKLVPLVGG